MGEIQIQADWTYVVLEVEHMQILFTKCMHKLITFQNI